MSKKMIVFLLAYISLAYLVGVYVGRSLHQRNQIQQLRPCTDIIRYPGGKLVCEIDIQQEDDTI